MMKKILVFVLLFSMCFFYPTNCFAENVGTSKTTVGLTIPKKQYTITLKSDNATVIYNNVSYTSIKVDEKSKPTFTVRLNDGYAVTKVTLNDKDVSNLFHMGSITLEEVTSDITLVFETAKDVKGIGGHIYVLTKTIGGSITKKSTAYYTCSVCGATTSGEYQTKTSKTLYKGQTYNEKVKGSWKSSNKKVCTVTSNGKITAKKVGTATVTGVVNGVTYKCKIKVKNRTLTISKSSISLKVGKTQTITAKTAPSATIQWSTSSKKIATVSNGKIKAKKKGKCTITAKANGITRKIKVTVK